jgi:tetratricopeptide (TPR) repeat protein
MTSDRYAYLPSVGVLLIVAWLIAKLAERFPGIVASSAIAVVLVLAVLSYKQSLVWKDTFILFTHVSEVQPRAYVAWSNIGTEEVRRGRPNEGLRAYTKALQIRDDATTWYNVGQILRAQGKREMAMEAYERAVASSPLEEDAKKALEELRMEN